VDGVASLTAFVHGLLGLGAWTTERGSNLLDGGAPFYDTYATSDDGFVAVGALEPQFYAELLDRLGLDGDDWPQHDRSRWPAFRAELTRIFGSATREHWAERFADSDACVAPLLTLEEAPRHPHLEARGTFTEVDGRTEPAPAPRLSRTPGEVRTGPPGYGAHTDEVLGELGLDTDAIALLRASGAVA
jgi:alpha-methylacyl-CoA racemase